MKMPSEMLEIDYDERTHIIELTDRGVDDEDIIEELLHRVVEEWQLIGWGDYIIGWGDYTRLLKVELYDLEDTGEDVVHVYGYYLADMKQREITAAGVFGDGTGERWLVLEYDDGSREAYASQWLDEADRAAILSDDEATVREWLRRVQREGVADWTIDADEIMAGTLLDGYEGIGLYGVGVGW